VVLVDDLETLEHTPDVIAALTAAGVYADVERARDGKNVRPGRGKDAGTACYKQPRSLLIVTAGELSALHGTWQVWTR